MFKLITGSCHIRRGDEISYSTAEPRTYSGLAEMVEKTVFSRRAATPESPDDINNSDSNS